MAYLKTASESDLAFEEAATFPPIKEENIEAPIGVQICSVAVSKTSSSLIKHTFVDRRARLENEQLKEMAPLIKGSRYSTTHYTPRTRG